MPWIGRISSLTVLALLQCTSAGAQQPGQCNSLPCTTVHTIAASDQAVPLEYTFSIAVPGDYQLTLTDLGAQAPFNAPLAYVKLAITSGSTIVGTPLTAAGTTQFSASAGTYVVHVTGKPGAGLGSGPVGIQIESTGGTGVAQFSGVLALPATGLPSNESVLSNSFTVQTAGNFQLALADLQFPQALSVVLAVIIAPGAASPVAVLGAGGPTTTTVSLQATTYDVFAVGQAGSNSGLFSVTVTPAGGATPLKSWVVPIGTTTLIGNATLGAESYTLKIADLQFPSPLAQLGAVVTLDGQAVQPPLTAAGSQQFAASAATYQVFAAATAGATGGSYTVDLTSSGGESLIDVGQAVSAPGGGVAGYSFDTNLQSGGAYTLDLADFDLPLAFTTLQAVAVQGGTMLGSGLDAAGSASISPTSGPLSLLVFATPNANSAPSAGLFGIAVSTGSGASPAFQATQAVGQLFASQQVSITTPGSYSVTGSDVGFPETLQSLSVVVTQGAKLIGKIFSAGTFTFSATPGNYVLNVLAQPQPPAQTEDEAGTYATTVSSAPSPPTASLMSNVTSVHSGGSVLLQWSSTAATSCTASSSPQSGFSGTVATSGQQMSAALTESTTFTLTCTGAGGTSQPKSVTITVTLAKSGGGAATPALLVILAALVALRGWRQAHRYRRPFPRR
jgi:hypothetical protein